MLVIQIEYLFPLDCYMPRFDVVSGMGELGLLLLSYRKNRVVAL